MTFLQLDPLLEPFSLKGLRLRNRVVSTSQEPAYGENGLPTERYTAHHAEKARVGIGMTMIGGSTVVPWPAKVADEVHGQAAATMMRLTRLGRRSGNFAGDWLPRFLHRRPAHHTFPRRPRNGISTGSYVTSSRGRGPAPAPLRQFDTYPSKPGNRNREALP